MASILYPADTVSTPTFYLTHTVAAALSPPLPLTLHTQLPLHCLHPYLSPYTHSCRCIVSTPFFLPYTHSYHCIVSSSASLQCYRDKAYSMGNHSNQEHIPDRSVLHSLLYTSSLPASTKNTKLHEASQFTPVHLFPIYRKQYLYYNSHKRFNSTWFGMQ